MTLCHRVVVIVCVIVMLVIGYVIGVVYIDLTLVSTVTGVQISTE